MNILQSQAGHGVPNMQLCKRFNYVSQWEHHYLDLYSDGALDFHFLLQC